MGRRTEKLRQRLHSFVLSMKGHTESMDNGIGQADVQPPLATAFKRLDVERLVALGFPAMSAQHALQACSGKIEEAAIWLLDEVDSSEVQVVEPIVNKSASPVVPWLDLAEPHEVPLFDSDETTLNPISAAWDELFQRSPLPRHIPELDRTAFHARETNQEQQRGCNTPKTPRAANIHRKKGKSKSCPATARSFCLPHNTKNKIDNEDDDVLDIGVSHITVSGTVEMDGERVGDSSLRETFQNNTEVCAELAMATPEAKYTTRPSFVASMACANSVMDGNLESASVVATTSIPTISLVDGDGENDSSITQMEDTLEHEVVKCGLSVQPTITFEQGIQFHCHLQTQASALVQSETKKDLASTLQGGPSALAPTQVSDETLARIPMQNVAKEDGEICWESSFQQMEIVQALTGPPPIPCDSKIMDAQQKIQLVSTVAPVLAIGTPHDGKGKAQGFETHEADLVEASLVLEALPAHSVGGA